MVIIKPLKLLVCLAVLFAFIPQSEIIAYTSPDLSGVPGIQSDALSADPRPPQSVQTLRTRPQSTITPYGYGSNPTSTRPYTGYKGVQTNPGPGIAGPAFPRASAGGYAACPPTASACGPFGQGMPFGLTYTGFVPRVGPRQFQLAARLWYATLNNSKIVWGTQPGGIPGTELDLHDNLGLRKHEYIPEYEARCQIRCNWGLRFSFMPIVFRDNFLPQTPFYFGNALYAPFFSTLTQWNRYIYRWDLVYDWYQRPHAVSSIFAGYALYDDKLKVSQSFAVIPNRSRSQGFGLAYAGMSIDRAIRNLGCSGAAASINCKWSVQFLEGYFGWDGYVAGRISVPMYNGRFGYLEAGWRWIVLQRDYPSNADKTNLDGVIGAVGLIF